MFETGQHGLHPTQRCRRYRISYGQNGEVPIEVSPPGGPDGGELGADAAGKRGGLPDSWARPLTWKQEAFQHLLGADIARKYREHPSSSTASWPTTTRSPRPWKRAGAGGGRYRRLRPGARRDAETAIKRLAKPRRSPTAAGGGRGCRSSQGVNCVIKVKPEDERRRHPRDGQGNALD